MKEIRRQITSRSIWDGSISLSPSVIGDSSNNTALVIKVQLGNYIAGIRMIIWKEIRKIFYSRTNNTISKEDS